MLLDPVTDWFHDSTAGDGLVVPDVPRRARQISRRPLRSLAVDLAPCLTDPTRTGRPRGRGDGHAR